ncbi:DUF4349 domain-containing protein [Streptomyces sp. NPDC004609]|uniref:DUF4349 domain-containing protein n=1 Tax=Streptomyces sp. NPDC004609 TaxID=3364704 RepID=UPI00369D89ED
MRGRRVFAALLLTASLAVAGCGAGGGDSSQESALDKAQGAAPEAGAGPGADSDAALAEGPRDGKTAAPQASGGPGASRGKISVAPSHVIRTAVLEIEVKDAEKALAAARRTAENAGGHVADESTERLDDTQMSSRIVLRVPQQRYAEVLADLAKGGKLISRKSDAKDVTDQVVDVESRIATQRASVTRVRELMDRAVKLADIVTLEGELSNRQAELESLLAQQAALKDRTSMSTITLELSEPAAEEKRKQDDDPGFTDALGGGWDALTATVRWIGVVLGAVFPFAVALGVLYALWRLVIRPLLPKRRTAVAARAQAPAPLPAYGTGPVPAPAAEAEAGSGPGQDPEPDQG